MMAKRVCVLQETYNRQTSPPHSRQRKNGNTPLNASFASFFKVAAAARASSETSWMLSVARAGDGGCDVPGVDGLDVEEAVLELDIVLNAWNLDVLQIL